ncbi:MAG: DUF1772 domain-containing protein [Parvibaculum sp.]|uniref:DUF1772 domain-containing protein n=1 Tax=Parvibaculum sp. TaxID=2024848 RepID=UPI0032642C89
MRVVPAFQFIALVLAALALIPAGAHFFELPNKMALDGRAYLTVQQIYAGWSLFGIALIGSLAANLALAVAVRRERIACVFATAAFASMLTVLLLFFAFVYPMNAATENWTVMPENWEALRMQWEYGHAVNAVLTFVAFVCVSLSVVVGRR